MRQVAHFSPNLDSAGPNPLQREVSGPLQARDRERREEGGEGKFSTKKEGDPVIYVSYGRSGSREDTVPAKYAKFR